MILRDEFTLLQALIFDSLSFDPFALLDDGLRVLKEVSAGVVAEAQELLGASHSSLLRYQHLPASLSICSSTKT